MATANPYLYRRRFTRSPTGLTPLASVGGTWQQPVVPTRNPYLPGTQRLRGAGALPAPPPGLPWTGQFEAMRATIQDPRTAPHFRDLLTRRYTQEWNRPIGVHSLSEAQKAEQAGRPWQWVDQLGHPQGPAYQPGTLTPGYGGFNLGAFSLPPSFWQAIRSREEQRVAGEMREAERRLREQAIAGGWYNTGIYQRRLADLRGRFQTQLARARQITDLQQAEAEREDRWRAYEYMLRMAGALSAPRGRSTPEKSKWQRLAEEGKNILTAYQIREELRKLRRKNKGGG